MRAPRIYLKQKPHLYFDENFPEAVTRHFRRLPYWRRKIRVTSAAIENCLNRDDRFHYEFCKRNGYTLVTLDNDFANDRLYPFTNGKMAGIIVIRASSSEVQRIVSILATFLNAVITIPFPRGFLAETKVMAALSEVTMRGRNARSKEIVEFRVTPGQTNLQQIRDAFGY